MTTDHNTIITHTHIYIGKIIEPYVHSVVKPTRSHNQTNTTYNSSSGRNVKTGCYIHPPFRKLRPEVMIKIMWDNHDA